LPTLRRLSLGGSDGTPCGRCPALGAPAQSLRGDAARSTMRPRPAKPGVSACAPRSPPRRATDGGVRRRSSLPRRLPSPMKRSRVAPEVRQLGRAPGGQKGVLYQQPLRVHSPGTGSPGSCASRRGRGPCPGSPAHFFKLHEEEKHSHGVAVCQKPFRFNTSARWRCWKDFRSPEWRGV